MDNCWILERCKPNLGKKWPWKRNHSDDRNYSTSPDHAIPNKNRFLDISTKRVAIKVFASVVSLITYSDGEKIFQGTGTIIEEVGSILTSAELVRCPTRKDMVAKNLKIIVYLWNGKSYEAQLLAYEFYYGIAVVKIQEDVPQLKPACLRLVDDGISVDRSEFHIDNDKGFKLRPGNKVIAIGRDCVKPYYLMAAPGEFMSQVSILFCTDRYGREHFSTSCSTTKTSTGGPLVNHHAEVIGVTFHHFNNASFLPINIALKWLKHYKNYGKLCHRPLLGMELANFYTANLLVMEKIVLKFPNYVCGVIVENVEKGSSAGIVGISPNDLIVKCCGKPVASFLELCDMMWDKIGDSVTLVVLRANDDVPLELEIKADEGKQSHKRTRSFDGYLVDSDSE